MTFAAAALVTLAIALAVSTLALATIVRHLLVDNRRHVAALIAPSPAAAQRALLLPEPGKKPVEREQHEKTGPKQIGLS